MVILTLTDEERQRRLYSQAEEQGRVGEVLKTQPSDFQKKVNEAYLKVAREMKLMTLDAEGTIFMVQEKLRKLFEI